MKRKLADEFSSSETEDFPDHSSSLSSLQFSESGETELSITTGSFVMVKVHGKTKYIFRCYVWKFPPWYLYLVVVECLACLNDPESYAGGGIAARRVTHARQVQGDKPNKKVPWSKE